MFKKLFGGGGGAATTAAGGGPADPGAPAAAAASGAAPAPAAAGHRQSQLFALPEDADGPVDYAPPPLGVASDARLGGEAESAASLGKHFDAAEAGAAGAAQRPSFVWNGGGRSQSWLGGGADLGDGGKAGDYVEDAAVMRVPSAALARRMSQRSGALSADFDRRRSSANFSKLGSDHEGHSSWATAACHLVTAMIGAGILGLPNSFAWLGWIGGCVCLVFFLAVTVYCLFHLVECYHVGGIRHHAYADAVFHLCGKKHALILASAQRINMSMTAAAYILVGAHSMVFVAKAAYEVQGKEPTPFASSLRTQTIIFGALQIVMSQLPNLESAWWSSAIGAAMSVTYGVIAIVLGAMGASNRRGDFVGRPGASPVDKVFGVFNSLGNIAFAFSAAIITMEVTHTLREPPRAAASMRKSITAAMSTAFTLYALVSILGYAALGPDAPDDVLVGFEKVNFAPLWLAMLANAAVLVHMIAAVQTYVQPIFEWIEDRLLMRFPKAVGRVPPFVFRFVVRTPLMVLCTLVAIVMPAFSAITGLVGAATYWPTAVFYPLKCYRNSHAVSRRRGLLFTAINVALGLISAVAVAGAIQALVQVARTTAATMG